MTKKTALAMAFVAATAFAAAQMSQEDKSKRPSPPGTAEITLGGKKITVDYSRPKIRDPKTGEPRKIMGGLVPYDKVWRTGANEATSFVTEADLVVNGTSVPAGKYTLFTIPGEQEWTLIINKQTGQWGTEYDSAQDLARIEMDVAQLDSPVDQFTISFEKQSDVSAIMKLEWENTRASVDIEKEE